MSRSKCRHCGGGNVNRPRGLCWTCYYEPGVRDRYPITSKYARRGIKDTHKAVEVPKVPTEEPAGSEGKITALEDRAAKGLSLWHPEDSLAIANRPKKDRGRSWRRR